VLAKVAIALAVAAAGLAAVVAMQPSRFRITRSAAITAPAERLFAQVNDLRRWEAWSPWLKGDPGARMAYEGPPAGPGAVFTWSGNRNVGEGRMTITESRPDEIVRLRLDFMRPMSSTSTAEFTFSPDGNQTLVTWRMSGDKNFLAKAVHMAIDMDKMIGARFDEGLAQMKAIAEGKAGS
jgi:uncharacterized protein YndB with AHSA1/START domain